VPNAGARAFIAAGAIALAALCGEATAQVLYKWVDADGKTQYSDRPPKNFTGSVTRIEPDEMPPPVPRAIPKPAAKGVERGEEPGAASQDLASQRRELRRKLEADVKDARVKLDSARAALEAASSPQDDERQVIQQKLDRNHPGPGAGSASSGGMMGLGGMLGGAPRSNCRTVKGNDGKTVTTCPTMVPNDAYYDRIKGLEAAVKAAEDELEAAEQAYRRAMG
jgi:hypothetical protein